MRNSANSTIGWATRCSTIQKPTIRARPPQHAEAPRRPEPPSVDSTRGRTSAISPGGEEHQAGEVEPAGRALVASLGTPEHDGHPDRQHGDVDPEDQPPVDVHQQAADERADRQRQRRDRGPDPQRPRLLLTWEGVADDRQRERQHRRAPMPWTTLPAISIPSLDAAPESTEPPAKIARPT